MRRVGVVDFIVVVCLCNCLVGGVGDVLEVGLVRGRALVRALAEVGDRPAPV